MALGMFIRVYFSKIGKKTDKPLLITGFFTGSSIIVNACAATSLLEIYLFSLAPIGVFAATELTAMILEKTKVPRKKPTKTTEIAYPDYMQEI